MKYLLILSALLLVGCSSQNHYDVFRSPEFRLYSTMEVGQTDNIILNRPKCFSGSCIEINAGIFSFEKRTQLGSFREHIYAPKIVYREDTIELSNILRDIVLVNGCIESGSNGFKFGEGDFVELVNDGRLIRYMCNKK